MDETDAESTVAALADETRLSVLRVLAANQRETPADPAVGFADLRRTVGFEDSGNFSYHLDKLLGQYVHKTAEGYCLTHAGQSVASAVQSGVLASEEPRAVETGYECPVCASPIVARGTTGGVAFTCDDGHGLQELGIPPSALDRGVDVVLRQASRKVLYQLTSVADDTCPECVGDFQWTTVSLPDEIRESAGRAVLRAGCRRCGIVYSSPVEVWVLVDEAVRRRLRSAGIVVADHPPWEFPSLASDTERIDGEPSRYRITFVGDESVTVELDETATVTAIE
ncbi:DUF7351 domain-containing protein [Haloarchaeobius sp. DFWS5]|uniref:DUF7351 domain-containing protein n=1 Tax=Haloarchaeobius sp. DFWS5 TaxID=3446114 RepID=UPI003EBE7DFD